MHKLTLVRTVKTMRVRLASAIMGQDISTLVAEKCQCLDELEAAKKRAREFEKRLNYLLVTEGLLAGESDFENAETRVRDGLPADILNARVRRRG
jgi:hypothetical protein